PVSYLTTLGASADVQTVAYECRRYPCWGWSAYYDTPPHLRPRVFYGYAPHRDGDWFRYFYGRDGYIHPSDGVGYRKSPCSMFISLFNHAAPALPQRRHPPVLPRAVNESFMIND